MTQEQLARKVEAQATMLQPALYDAALKEGALATRRLPQLIAAAAAGVVEVGVTIATEVAAGSSLYAFHAAPVIHALALRLW